MLIFLSWSDERSRELAEKLHEWLPIVIQAVEPWMSKRDIDKGARWGEEMAAKLGKASYGIVCVTPENRQHSWLLFEAGALSKTPGSKVATLLLGLQPAQIEPPLSLFQATLATKEDVRKLVQDINKRLPEAGAKAVTESVLDANFEAHWPKLEAKVVELEKKQPAKVAKRTDSDILEEILELVRRQDRLSRLKRGDQTWESILGNLDAPLDVSWELPKSYRTIRRYAASQEALEALRNLRSVLRTDSDAAPGDVPDADSKEPKKDKSEG